MSCRFEDVTIFLVTLLISHLQCGYAQLENVTLRVDTPTSNPVIDGRPSVYLSDNVVINANLQIGDSGERIHLALQIPDEFTAKDNLTIIYGSNLQNVTEVVDRSDGQLTVTFDLIEVINASIVNNSVDNAISLSYLVYVSSFRDVGYRFNTTLTISYGPTYQKRWIGYEIMVYGGPGVEVEAVELIDGQFFIFDRELQTVISFEIPPGTWNMSNTRVYIEFYSDDIPFIDLDILQCLATSSSSNVTFSNPASQNVTNVNLPGSPASVTVQNATIGSNQGRRAVTSDNGARSTLIWELSDIANTGVDIHTVSMMVRGVIGQTVDTVSGVTLRYTSSMELNGEMVDLDEDSLVVSEPDLAVSKLVVESMQDVDEELDYNLKYLEFTTTLSHTAASTAPAYDVRFLDVVTPFVVLNIARLPYSSVSTDELVYVVEQLSLGESLTISYRGYFTEETVSQNLDSSIVATASADWRSMPGREVTVQHPGRSYGPTQDEACIQLVRSEPENVLIDYGLTALFFFASLLIGCVIVAIILFICLLWCKKAPYATVKPEGSLARNRGLVMNARGGAKTGLSALKEFSIIDIDDSIIPVLALKDKNRKRMEFENLDIWCTISIDIQLERQRLDLMVDSNLNLVNKWTQEGAIPQKVADRCNKTFQRRVKDLNRTLEEEYKEECRMLAVKLSAVNKRKLAEVQRKHKIEHSTMISQTKAMPVEERKDILQLLRQQHDAEKKEVSQLLKLQQDEDQEKTRKEIAIRNRLALKSLQQQHLDDIILTSEIDGKIAMQLLRQQRSNMANLEVAMDEEVANQRMLLEEKLAGRQALAQSGESLGEHHKLLLNTIATQTLTAIDDLEKDDKLTEEQAERYSDKLRQDLLAARADYDQERGKQEEALHKRLSDLKRKNLEEKSREHKQQVDQFEREQKVKLDSNSLDPSDYTEAKMSLLSSHRREIHDMELSLDEEAETKLEELHKELAQGTKETIDKSKLLLFKELTSQGMTERMKNELLEQHQRDVECLDEEYQEQRQKQERLLKKRLAKHRHNWLQRKQDEKQQQQIIRDYEDKILGRILASQLAISEEDRQRIMEEHKRQQVALENSLALSKLKQRRLLEEKVVERRARHMAKLQRRQDMETQREARKQQLAESDEEDGEDGRAEMMKKHAEEKITLLTEKEEEDRVQDELEEVRVEMMKSRVNTLKEQEERLGALVAKLQLERSREIATIEEQQRALWQLKMNMLDDMTESGAIRNADCKKVIEMHQKEAKTLESKLNEQRDKQEKEFKRRLRERLAEREAVFTSKQGEELMRLTENEKNKTSARLKRVALKHKHLVEMEEFRRSLEIEVNQALEDLRRTFEVEKLKQLQDQELRFMSGLVKHGNFLPAELGDALHLLFPSKTQEDLQPLMMRMYNKNADGQDIHENNDTTDGVVNGNLKAGSLRHHRSTKTKGSNSTGLSLEDKIKHSILGNTGSWADVASPNNNKQRPNKLLKKLKMKNKNKKKLAPLITRGGSEHLQDSDQEDDRSFQGNSALPGVGHRPDPIGRTATPQGEDRARRDSDQSEEETRLFRNGGKVAQLEYSY